MDLEHSLSQPPNFGTNYLTTYAHANLEPTVLRNFTLVITKIIVFDFVCVLFKFKLFQSIFNSNFFTLLSA